MTYLVVENHGYEGQSVQEFDDYDEAVAHIVDRLPNTTIDNFYSVDTEYDIQTVVNYYEKCLETRREAALAKLTKAERILLGL